MRKGISIYLIRHGETDWNRDRRYQGQADIPLNAKGRAQAMRNGTVLRSLLPAIGEADFVSSPLGRARETMEIVRSALTADPLNYRLDARLRELSYGHWEGQLQTDLVHTDPAGLAERAKDPFNWRPRGGESYADLLARTVGWLNTVEKDTVVVAHGGVSRCLRAHVCGLDPASIPELECPQDLVLRLSSNATDWL